ncbi:hypothetical protein B0H14DRAFT_2561393 [Mycena olivaceomarginata]|nr:hypothetical protein B0H14DRAFT_2561393 [Mycena olivaceomarginata]
MDTGCDDNYMFNNYMFSNASSRDSSNIARHDSGSILHCRLLLPQLQSFLSGMPAVVERDWTLEFLKEKGASLGSFIPSSPRVGPTMDRRNIESNSKKQAGIEGWLPKLLYFTYHREREHPHPPKIRLPSVKSLCWDILDIDDLQFTEMLLHPDPIDFRTSFIAKSNCDLEKVCITGDRVVHEDSYQGHSLRFNLPLSATITLNSEQFAIFGIFDRISNLLDSALTHVSDDYGLHTVRD